MVATLYARVVGVVFLVVGVAGFIPALTEENEFGQELLGFLQVNNEQNVIHLVTGALALFVATRGVEYAKTYAQVFGVVYAVVALWGINVLFEGGVNNDVLFGWAPVNVWTELVHIAVAVGGLYAGFMADQRSDEAAAVTTA